MKSTKLILAALCAVAVFSCAKENVNVVEKYPLTFSVTNELSGAESKAYFESNDVKFKADDRISVFDGSSNNCFTTTEGGATASFSGEAAEAATYVFVSPYNENHSVSGSVVTFEIPDVQTATPGGVDPKALISAGKAAKGNAVTLYNAVGLFKVVVPDGLTVKQIQVAGGTACNVGIAGRFTINTNNQVVNYVSAESMVNVITLIPEEGQSTIASGTYYIAVRPKTDYNGLTLAYVNGSNQLCKRIKAGTVGVDRSHVLPLGSLDVVNFAPVTGTAVLRTNGDEVQFTGRVKKLAGGSGTANVDDSVIKKIVFQAHTLYSSTYRTDASLLSSGSGTVQIFGHLEGDVFYVFTEAPTFTLQASSGDLFRQFVALEEVVFSDVTTNASTSFSYMFRNDAKLKKVDFGNADFSGVTDFSYMFYVGASSSLEYVNFGETATTAASTMQSMFNNAQNLKYLNFGPNFTLAGTNTNMFLDTAKQTSVEAAGDNAKKCQLYSSQTFYDSVKDGVGGFNSARFFFHAL